MKIISSLFNLNKSDISDYQPILGFHDDKTIITKDGNYCSVFMLDGVDYSSLSKDETVSNHRLMMNMLKGVPETINIYFHSLRTFENASFDDSENHLNQVASKIAEKWSLKFRQTYKTSHYIVISTGSESAIDELDSFIKNEEKVINRFTDLDEASVMIKKLLNSFNPMALKNNELYSFWGNVLNGSNQRFVNPISNFDDYLHESHIKFPIGKPYMKFDNGKERYSMVLSVKFFESDTDSQMFNDILHLKSEFRIVQYTQRINKSKTLNMINEREKTAEGFLKNNTQALIELEELSERVQADEVNLMRYNYSIYCYGDTEQECKNVVNDIKGIVHQYGFTTAIESSNIQALFWGMFPTNQRYLIRKRFLTNENVSALQTFASTSIGLESCSWGHAPHTKFLTSHGNVFNFTFQQKTKKQALGHTLVFGGSDAGKTTLICFLLSACQRYDGFKSIIFDKLQGTRVFTESHDGVYVDFSKSMELNPLQLEDNGDNRAFLAKFYRGLAGLKDEDETIDEDEIISEAIDMLFDGLEPEQRTFDNMLEAFGLATHSQLRKALNQWGSSGSFGHIFTSKKDALDFHKDIVTFNMDNLFQNPKILANVMFYIKYKFKEFTKNDHVPHAMFVDEIREYLKDEITSPLLVDSILEMRKLEGVFIGAAQSPNHITESEDGVKLISSCANFIFFRDANADKKILKDIYNLKDTEIDWIKYDGEPRQILFKRNGGSSVVLDVDLSSLNGYLELFDSSTEKRKKMQALQQDDSINWVDELIKQGD